MALPETFLEALSAVLGNAQAQALVHTIEETEPSVSIRINPAKCPNPDAIGGKRVPWCSDTGRYLDQRTAFTFDPALHAGRYYVQDASSMFISHVIKSLVSEPVRYLDLCAAPGGKTTAALSALPEGSLVVANEIVPLRAQILRENVIKWGYPNAVVTHNAPDDFNDAFENFFDVIATDVPCSGEGMMRKDSEAVAQWSPALVQECADRQKHILSSIWHCLRPGGLLIYSTCTYNAQENEQMVRYICETLGADSIQVPVEEAWNIAPAVEGNAHCYRFMPHRVQGEGLFMSVLRKHGDGPLKCPNTTASHLRSRMPAAFAHFLGWLNDSNNYLLPRTNDGTYNAYPKDHEQALNALIDHLRVIHAGVPLAALKGKDAVPQHAIALSTALREGAFPECEVDFAQAIAYLRGEAIALPAGTPRGMVIITHRQSRLGFVKNLGNRANNLYPKEWRIRSTHITQPDSPLL